MPSGLELVLKALIAILEAIANLPAKADHQPLAKAAHEMAKSLTGEVSSDA